MVAPLEVLSDAVPFYIDPSSPEITTLLDTFHEYTGSDEQAFIIGGALCTSL